MVLEIKAVSHDGGDDGAHNSIGCTVLCKIFETQVAYFYEESPLGGEKKIDFTNILKIQRPSSDVLELTQGLLLEMFSCFFTQVL